MRCDRCPLCPPYDEVCEVSESEYGLEHKDGMWGCKHPYNWAKKRADEYVEYLEKMAEGMEKMLEEERNDERIIYDLGNCKDV